MLSSRFSKVSLLVLAHSGMKRPEFERLPRFARRPDRKTVAHYHRACEKSRYDGAALRKIRANGQASECKRRLAQGSAAFAIRLDLPGIGHNGGPALA
jgi:hypothetical protein